MSRWIIGLCFYIIAWSTVAEVPLEALYEQPLVKNIKISPGGEYLAIKVFIDGYHSLRFVNRKNVAHTGGLRYRGTNEVGDYFWANNERVVAEVHEVGKTQEAPQYTGELFAINYDSKRAEAIFGYRSGEQQVGSRLRKKTADYAWAEIVDVLPDNDRLILISSTPMSKAQDRRPIAQYLDIYNGQEKGSAGVSKFPMGTFYTDQHHEIRLITSLKEDRSLVIQSKPGGVDEWLEIEESSYGNFFYPLAISDDLQSVYVLDNINNDKVGMHKLELTGKNYNEIYTNDQVDITDVNMTTDGRLVYAMRLDKGYPSYLIFSNSSEEATIFKHLLQTFSGRVINITSRSRDGRFWTVYTSTDIDAGSFYLYDHQTASVSLLFRAKPNIDTDTLAQVEPISFTSFDGRTIAGYFTRAITSNDKPAPLVVLVHGGPRARDYWQFDPDVQALATHGFSVLQVNYRGSDGYGNAFLRAGNRHWGDLVQQDIIAGTRWAISEKLAEKNNICIMGASFGAYSAVQSAILAPELFNCAVANAGIYDLALMYETGDIERRYSGEAYLEEVIGRDEEELKKFSPVYNVDKLTIPIFIAHGRKDDRAPIEHAKRLRKALDRNKKPYVWFEKKREAHGFYDKSNQIEFMEKALRFLSKNLN